MGWPTKSFKKSSRKKKDGYVYVISNTSFEGWYKLGVTHDIESRLRTYQTSSPYRNYKIEYYIHHPDCYAAERAIQSNLYYFAPERKKEWFRCSLQIVKDRVDESLTAEELPLTFFKS